MNKFKKTEIRANLLAEAAERVIDAAYAAVRYDCDYVHCGDDEEADLYNYDWLDQHLTADGKEYLQIARDLYVQLEKLL